MNKRDLDTQRGTLLLKLKKIDGKIGKKKEEIQRLEEEKQIIKEKMIANEGHFHKDYAGSDE